MTRSIYHHPRLYRLAMRVAYRSEYRDRYARLADHIAAPSRVVEVCCGDLALHDHLARRGLLSSYRGLDSNPGMVSYARRRGVWVELADLRTTTHIPSAEVVIMQASAYQFHDTAEALLVRLWGAASGNSSSQSPYVTCRRHRIGSCGMSAGFSRAPKRVSIRSDTRSAA